MKRHRETRRLAAGVARSPEAAKEVVVATKWLEAARVETRRVVATMWLEAAREVVELTPAVVVATNWLEAAREVVAKTTWAVA